MCPTVGEAIEAAGRLMAGDNIGVTPSSSSNVRRGGAQVARAERLSALATGECVVCPSVLGPEKKSLPKTVITDVVEGLPPLFCCSKECAAVFSGARRSFGKGLRAALRVRRWVSETLRTDLRCGAQVDVLADTSAGRNVEAGAAVVTSVLYDETLGAVLTVSYTLNRRRKATVGLSGVRPTSGSAVTERAAALASGFSPSSAVTAALSPLPVPVEGEVELLTRAADGQRALAVVATRRGRAERELRQKEEERTAELRTRAERDFRRRRARADAATVAADAATTAAEIETAAAKLAAAAAENATATAESATAAAESKTAEERARAVVAELAAATAGIATAAAEAAAAAVQHKLNETVSEAKRRADETRSASAAALKKARAAVKASVQPQYRFRIPLVFEIGLETAELRVDNEMQIDTVVGGRSKQPIRLRIRRGATCCASKRSRRR